MTLGQATGECGLETLAGGEETALDGFGGYGEVSGDLIVREVCKVEELDGLSLVVGETVDRFVQDVVSIREFGRGQRIGGGVGDVQRRVEGQHGMAPATNALALGSDDAFQPDGKGAWDL